MRRRELVDLLSRGDWDALAADLRADGADEILAGL